MKDPDQQIPENASGDLFSPLEDGTTQEQRPQPGSSSDYESLYPLPPVYSSISASEPEQGAEPDPMPTPEDTFAPPEDDEEAPLYYAPGEPLSGKPGEYFRRQNAQAAVSESAPSVPEEQLAASDSVMPQDHQSAPSDSDLPEETQPSASVEENPAAPAEPPHFENIRVTGPDADRFLDEISRLPPESSRPAATASADLFRNVALKSGPAPENRDLHEMAAAVHENSTPAFEPPKAEIPVPPRRHHGIHNSFKILLFLRQILASFFTHTALGVLFPRVAAKLGPCFPSSMPLPYFLIGFVTALPILAVKAVLDVPDMLGCALATAVFIVFNGISGFRGITKLCAVFSSSRSDFALATTVTATYIMVLLALLLSLTYLMEPSWQFALILGVTLSLSALAGCSLQFSLEADPVDSYGSMSLKGLLFALILVLLAVYALLPPLVATSMVGMALLCNLLFGLYMNLRGLLISRSAVGAVQLVTQLLLMLYLTIASGRMLI